jgi:outer membrane biosynthesis protein TonB
MNDVTDILRDRAREPGGFERMAAVSAFVHIVFAVLVLVVPGAWFSSAEAPRRSVMTISLGGAPGPATGGMTPAAARPVQEAQAEPPARPEPVRPPAQKAPEMIVPKREAPKRAAAAPVRQAPEDARGKTPTKGEEVQSGAAVGQTLQRGQGFSTGLSGGGGGGGDGVRLDVADFCCPDYVKKMVEQIRANWDARTEVAGVVGMKFTIQRDGTLTDIANEQSSRFQALDLKAHRALLATRKLDPLPAAFPNPTLTVHLGFDYQR